MGSSDSIAGVNTVLNTIVADALAKAADELEGAEDFETALNARIARNMREHKRIIFNGDGYSRAWTEEASRRGLPNLRTMVDAIPVLTRPENVALYEKYKIFTRSELESRTEVLYETYTKMKSIEARTMVHMAGKHYIPTVVHFISRMSDSVNKTLSASPEADVSVQRDLINRASALLAEAYREENVLSREVEKLNELDNAVSMSFHCRDILVPHMKALRAAVDALELMVDKSLWPVPTYGDLTLGELKKLGAIAGVHCENAGIIDALTAARKAAGELGPASHPLSRPALAEAEAVGRLLKMACLQDAPVVAVHTSCAAAMAEVEAARARGQKLFVETCPQYLLLEDRYYSLPDFEGARYVCAPPLRKPRDQARLWRGLAAGEIQTVNTDHCSFSLKQKDAGRGDFSKIPGGLPGVETRFELLYSYGVAAGRISREKLAEVLSANNAKLYGLWGRKGAIREGFDADLVVYDPRGEHAIHAADCIANVDYNPYEGFPINGSIRQVWLRGSLAVENGELRPDIAGQYLHRALPML